MMVTNHCDDSCKQVIVGLSSHVITERQPVVSPGNQLAEAQQYLRLSSKASDFIFSAEVSIGGRETCVCVHVLVYVCLRVCLCAHVYTCACV